MRADHPGAEIVTMVSSGNPSATLHCAHTRVRSPVGSSGRREVGGPPISVEIFIRTTLDELWERTQIPALHQRWDLRFTDIEYLPCPDESQPQRFQYETRIGFGLRIAGEGESVDTRADARGVRTSALRFWSDDPKSLIRTGPGYWQYVPVKGGVRFLTRYDYETRLGPLGRLVDRMVFRPLIG